MEILAAPLCDLGDFGIKGAPSSLSEWMLT